MVLPELTTYLQAQSVGTQAVDLFYGLLPATQTADPIVVLFEYGGSPNEPDLGAPVGAVRVEYPSIQAVVRGLVADDYDTPRLKIQQVVTAFAKICDQQLSGILYNAVIAKQPPFFLRRDENFRVLMACNFEVTKGYSAS